ncbi:hypothetical protein BD289DRAFT_366768 [Coniella lustricola]|uniref:Uncharacterized protein n=1 Tax=Coniella lustricola TaxID=2025994 RepID=A0A2T3AAI1_9PEZI|nr:hypothetical protein BD289DRAFT_366768 [Coniella lustricola]
MAPSQPTNIPRRLAPTGRTRDVDEDDHVEIGNNNDNNNNGHPPLIKASAKAKRAVSAAKEQASIPKDGLPENLDQLLLLQLQEDLDAWQYDLEFCRAQLDANMVVNITPAEARTFQIRVLDIGHQMRTIRHRIQYMHMTSKNALDAQAAGPAAAVGARTGTGSLTPKNGTPAPVPAADRGHGSSHESLAVRKDKIRGHGDGVSAALSSSANPVGDINNISGARISPYQRLGHWNCRLCTSHKYMSHPGPKQPSEPSMWPLRDISKIVTHLTRMHGEHSNPERCMELGAALDSNRGPFRYWVQITKRERGTSDAECDACISELKNGSLPSLLRRLSTAAKAFPKTG